MPTLTANDVHVWSVGLDDPSESVHECLAMLSADEWDRAWHFGRPQDGLRFVVARARLRAILSHYLGVDPRNVRLRSGRYGKPELAVTFRPPLAFNTSHSGAVAVYAIAAHGRVGIDVERMSRSVDHEAIAERFFSAAESASLRAVPEPERAAAFFSCWTRKEAYVKALGDGLSYPFHEFTVSIGRDRPAALIDHAADPDEPRRWSLVDLPMPAEYVAAVAFDGPLRRLQCCGDWSEHAVRC